MTSRLLVLSLVAIGLAGCMSTPRPPSNEFNSEKTANLLSEGPPKPAPTIGIDSSNVVPDQVRIEPEKAVGYQDLPTSITQLYTMKPVPLGMAQVVTQALANNRGLKISGYTLRIAEYQVPISKSIYDTLVAGSAQYQKAEIQTLGNGKTEERTKTAALSLAQLVPTGATISASYDAMWNANQFFNTAITGLDPITNQPITSIVPGTRKSVTQDVLLGVTQPLLRNFGPTVTNAPIVVAQLERVGAAADFQAELERTISGSLSNYWLLIGAIETYKVRIISYAAALDLLRVNRAKFEAEVLARVDVVQAEAAVENRRERLIVARQDVRDLEDQLKRRIFLGEDKPQWLEQIQPTQPFAWRETKIDLDDTLRVALAERPELRRAQSNIEQARVNERVARNQMLPELNLFANGGLNGIDRGYNSSGSNMLDGEYNSYSAGLSLSYPLQNRFARYRYAQAQVRSAQAGESFNDLGDQITLEVRRAVRAVQTARERIDVTAAAVRAEERKVQDERARLEVGAATMFEILTFQEELANAQVLHLQAVVDYNIAAIELERARGTLLRTYGIEVISPDLKPRTPPVRFPIGLN